MGDLLNIYVCIIAPLLLMFFMLKNDSKKLNLFLILGMSACLTASYANMYLIELTGYSDIQVTYYVTPICEETIKALPVLFYVLVFKPKSDNIITASMAVGIGFATLENCYYIMMDGARDFMFLLLRGFATGVMHGMCTAIIGLGLVFIIRQKGLAFTGTFGLLCSAITYHATYNLLISSRGLVENIGICMPIATAATVLTVVYKPYKRFQMGNWHPARYASRNRRYRARHKFNKRRKIMLRNSIHQKALSVLLAFSMVLSVFQFAGVPALAKGISDSQAAINSEVIIDSGYCGVKNSSLRWELTKNDTDSTKYTLTISGSGNMADYANEESPWHSYCEQITKLVLEDGITSIGNFAFEDCEKITGDLKIPNGVTSIGKEAFLNCFSLRGSLKIPDSVTSIGYGAFWSCDFTGSLIIPNSVTSIKERAFYSSGFTGSLEIPNSVTSIRDWTFVNCGFTGELEIPNSVTSIGYGAFCKCTGFKGILTIPNSVTNIGVWALEGCTGFTKAIIPMSVTDIGETAFLDWKSGSTIYNLSNKTMTEGTHYSGAKLGTVYAVSTHVGNNGTDYKAAGDSDFPFTLIAPEKENYIFTGWYTDSNFKNAWTGNGKAVTSNLTIYAKFKKILSVSDIVSVKNKDNAVYDGKTKEMPVTVTLSGYNSNVGTPAAETATATAKVSGPGAGIYTSYTLSGIELPQSSNYTLAGAASQFTITDGETEKFGVTIGKAENVIAIAYKTWEKAYGDVPFALTGISNTANAKMEYASNNLSVATVDGIGNVTITGVGAAVITVSAPETENYKAAANQIVTVTVAASSNGSHHSSDTPAVFTPSLPSIVTNAPTGTAADLSGTTMPAGVTSVTLSVTQETQNTSANPQAASIFQAIAFSENLKMIGTPFVYNIKLLDQKRSAITDFGGSVTVRLPLPTGLRGMPRVFRYEPDTKTFTDMNAVVENGLLVFSTTHFSNYIIAGTGNFITLDTTSYTMPVGGVYHIGMKFVNTQGTTVKVSSSDSTVASAVQFANGVCRVNGKKSGTVYILYDVYDNKNHLLTHFSVHVDVKTGIRPRGDSTRQYGVF